MELSRKIIRTIISLNFTIILLNNPMMIIMVILFALSIIEVLLSIRLYKLVSKANRGDCCETEYNIDKDVNYKYSHSKI